MNVGQVVTITDINNVAVIVDAKHYAEGTVYLAVSLTGITYARIESEMAPADEDTAAQFTQDIKILAPTHPELAVAFSQVIGPRDTVVPGTVLADIKPVTMPSGVRITRREIAAEMITTKALKGTVRSRANFYGPFIRSVTEVI